MPFLAGTLYDPATANTAKLTSTNIAMTAVDTTNLRLTFTVPASGVVVVRLQTMIRGATTTSAPVILLGVMEGSTVRGRIAPMMTLGPSGFYTPAEALFVVTGLTPGASLTWDAAYGVETAVASTSLAFGGPDTSASSNGFGGFAFEIYAA